MSTFHSTDNSHNQFADRRMEPRADADLTVMVWGVDTRGERFLQEARARDISLGGAMLSGLGAELRPGDVIGVLYRGRKARYRVVWIRYSGEFCRTLAAIHRVAPDECPWKELLATNQSVTNPTVVWHPDPQAGNLSTRK